MIKSGRSLIQIQYGFVVHKRAVEKKLARREFVRLKQINTYVPEFTGENAVHEWLDPKKIKILAKFYQDVRNQNRHTVKIEKKDKDKLNEFMKGYAEQMYIRKVQEEYWLNKHHEKMAIVESEVETLPFILRNELSRNLSESEQTYYKQLDREPETYYYEQILRLMPEEDGLNYELANRIGRIATDKLNQSE